MRKVTIFNEERTLGRYFLSIHSFATLSCDRLVTTVITSRATNYITEN